MGQYLNDVLALGITQKLKLNAHEECGILLLPHLIFNDCLNANIVHVKETAFFSEHVFLFLLLKKFFFSALCFLLCISK